MTFCKKTERNNWIKTSQKVGSYYVMLYYIMLGDKLDQTDQKDMKTVIFIY